MVRGSCQMKTEKVRNFKGKPKPTGRLARFNRGEREVGLTGACRPLMQRGANASSTSCGG